jgi:hypothetical protein
MTQHTTTGSKCSFQLYNNCRPYSRMPPMLEPAPTSYTLYVAFGDAGEIEAAADRDQLKTRWNENYRGLQPVEIRELVFHRTEPAPRVLVLQAGHLEVHV